MRSSACQFECEHLWVEHPRSSAWSIRLDSAAGLSPIAVSSCNGHAFLFMMTGEVVGKLQHFTSRRQWALYFCGEQNHMGVSSGLVLLFHSQGERLYSKSIHREELLLVWKKWWQYDGYCIFLFWDGMVKRTTVVDYGTEMKKTTSDHTIQVCVSL